MTGCVATACAQLMSIYNFPSQYNGYTFNWNDMTATPSATNCSVQATGQIARLMQQLGLSTNLNMDYGIEESGADPKNIPRTLKNFGYTNGGTLVDYKTDEIVSELIAGYPVLVGGKLEKHQVLGFTYYDKGHRWLCYGLLKRSRELKVYDSSNHYLRSYEEIEWYPYCNWGWGSSGDGYYLSNAFDVYRNHYNDHVAFVNYSEAPQLNFQYDVTAVIGIRK